MMEAIPSDGIAPMSSEQKAKLIRLVLQNSRLETPEDYVPESAGACSDYSRLFEFAGTENVAILVVNVAGVNLDFGC